MKVIESTSSNNFGAWVLTILGIGLELLAAAIWQESGLAKSIAHSIVSVFIK